MRRVFTHLTQDGTRPCIAMGTRIVPLWPSTIQQKCGNAAPSSPLPSPASVLITSHNGARPAKPQARALLALKERSKH